MAMCWNIIKQLNSLYGEQRILPKVEKNAVLAVALMKRIKKAVEQEEGYWRKLKAYYSMPQFQEETVKAQFKLLKKPIDEGFKYIQFFYTSLGQSRHQDIKEKIALIVKNWNEIVDMINNQFPKGKGLKLLLKKDQNVSHFV